MSLRWTGSSSDGFWVAQCDRCSFSLVGELKDDDEWLDRVLDRHRRNEHMPLVTKTGKVLTDEDIEKLVEEAEHGYDVEALKLRLPKVHVQLVTDDRQAKVSVFDENGNPILFTLHQSEVPK